MADKERFLDGRGKGEFSYDYKNDILFFKIKDREYQKSLDFQDIVVDIDKEGFATGIQIFDVSKMFNIDKTTLNNIKNWQFQIKIEDNIVTMQFMFAMLRRNKEVERGENLVREADSQLKDAEVLCTIPTK